MPYIRQATAQDAPTLLRFILELAAYEKMSDQVRATEQALRQSLTNCPPDFEAILISENAKAEWAGFALFFPNYSTFEGKKGIHLEDLYVCPKYRGMGFGKSLMCYLAQIASDRDCPRLEWTVLDWNKPAIDFYHQLGANLLGQWRICRLDRLGMSQLVAHPKSSHLETREPRA